MLTGVVLTVAGIFLAALGIHFVIASAISGNVFVLICGLIILPVGVLMAIGGAVLLFSALFKRALKIGNRRILY